MQELTSPSDFAALVADRAIRTTDALLAELNPASKKPIFSNRTAEVIQQVLKIAIALDNLHIAQRPPLSAQNDELRDRYFSLIRLLLRISDELTALNEKA